MYHGTGQRAATLIMADGPLTASVRKKDRQHFGVPYTPGPWLGDRRELKAAGRERDGRSERDGRAAPMRQLLEFLPGCSSSV